MTDFSHIEKNVEQHEALYDQCKHREGNAYAALAKLHKETATNLRQMLEVVRAASLHKRNYYTSVGLVDALAKLEASDE